MSSVELRARPVTLELVVDFTANFQPPEPDVGITYGYVEDIDVDAVADEDGKIIAVRSDAQKRVAEFNKILRANPHGGELSLVLALRDVYQNDLRALMRDLSSVTSPIPGWLAGEIVAQAGELVDEEWV